MNISTKYNKVPGIYKIENILTSDIVKKLDGNKKNLYI